MTGYKLQIIGADALMRKLSPKNFKTPIADAVRKITIWYHAQVVVSTPVDQSRLRPSISFKVQGETGEVFTNVEYASFVEYGTRKMEARHVVRGSSVRHLGTGMFTYAMDLLNKKMKDFTNDIVKGIKMRFE